MNGRAIGPVHKQFPISDSSYIGDLRRAAGDMARANGFGEQAIGRAEIILSELASNLIKHSGGGGEVLLGIVAADANKALEMIALDRGPGMANPERMLQNGVSTSGTLGGGLGAIKRLSDEFDLDSKPGRGTAILSRIWLAPPLPGKGELEIGGVTVALPGEHVSGDRWAVRSATGTATILLTDGLGHGHKAAQAAEQSVAAFFDREPARPGELMHRLHEALHCTQGAAAAAAEVDFSRRQVTYSGVGNITGRVITSIERRGCVSMPGGLGFRLDKVQEFTFAWANNAVLLMHSDGLLSSATLDGYTAHKSSLLAALLYRDFRRGNDDAMAVVARNVS